VTNHSFWVIIEGMHMDFTQRNKLCFMASIRENTAYMDFTVPAVAEAALASHALLMCKLWHCHLCHISHSKIKQVLKQVSASGLKLDSDKLVLHICVPCVHSKQHWDPFLHKALNHSTTPLKHIFSNLHEVPCLTHSGFCYWLTFINNCMHCCWMYLLKKKSQSFEAFKLFKALIEKQ
jgi:hypothetical protein